MEVYANEIAAALEIIPLDVQSEGRKLASENIRKLCMKLNPEPHPLVGRSLKSLTLEIVTQLEGLDGRLTKPGNALMEMQEIKLILSEKQYRNFEVNVKSLNSTLGNKPLSSTERRNPERAVKKTVCFKCQKEGHWARDCKSSQTSGNSSYAPKKY